MYKFICVHVIVDVCIPSLSMVPRVAIQLHGS